KLPNGGVVFDCRDEAMARWLKEKDVMAQFLGKLGAACVYRPRRVELIAEMLLIDARIEEPGTWRLVESDSRLAKDAIASAWWVKAPGRRAQGQKVAHAKVEFTDAEAANHAI
ncbi:hypothetical protein K438DRAFT_1462908, partial [Mycena galopus ATCC 62051]